MSADFLLELLSEEIPARMQARARNDLSRMMAEALAAAGLSHNGITTYSTPRRLVLIARGLPAATEAVSEELKGPKTSAPAQAVEGFLRKTGLTQDQLEDRDGTWFATIDKPGRATADVLAEAVAAIVRDFPWPKSMRWGAASASTASMRWVRPLHSIIALLGEDIVPVAIDGVSCGAATLGHRFHHPGPITIGGAHDYVEKLRACHVLVDQEEREAIVRKGANVAAEDAGFLLVEDEGLVIENAGLTEWPVPLLGSFDPDYLDVPEEVIALTARTNQKYFVMRDPAGKLAPNFVCVANIDATDGGEAITAGNERVLAARLSDARFFWEQDLKIPLEEQAKKLEQIIFHEKLGTVADKVERVAKLARWLVEEGIVKGADPDQTERAARLAKADLVTGMVSEFPELQGIIGSHLSRAQGEPAAIADAIRDHYRPAGQGDQAPKEATTIAVNIADRFDSIAYMFTRGEYPTGRADPFALRRAALSLIVLVVSNQVRAPISLIFDAWVSKAAKEERRPEKKYRWEFSDIIHRLLPFAEKKLVSDVVMKSTKEVILLLQRIESQVTREEYFGRRSRVLNFFADRLKVQQRDAGVRHDLIDAVFSLGNEDDLVRLLSRVKALQSFVETGEGTNLLAGYKRAANILKKEQWDAADASDASILPDEAALTVALDAAGPTAAKAVEAEDFTAAMTALASLRAPIDAFFDKVIVNDSDAGVRARRLNLLARFRDAVHTVADFSKIEG